MLKVLPPDRQEIGWMDLKTVKLNCLTLGELENEPIFLKSECSFLLQLFTIYGDLLLTNKQGFTVTLYC